MKQLFKYVPEPRNLFEEGFIRLSQLSVLNDPFEASFYKKGLEELCAHFDDSMAHDPELGNLTFSKYVEMRMNRIGVVSFSENKENLLMWAHYANEHKGLVVGVSQHTMSNSIFHSLFRADSLINTSWGEQYSPFDGIPKPVSYRKGLRYRNDKFDYDYSNIDAEGADRVLHEVMMQKSDEWIYEQEHRVVLRLEQADRVIIENIQHIENEVIKNKVMTSSFSTIHSNNTCTINLYEIEDDVLRVSVSMQLAKLSYNPNTIYLMRLNPGSINNCLIGLKSAYSKTNIPCTFAKSIGYLDFWKAVRNFEYYCLDFEEL